MTGVMVLLATDGVIVEGVRPETSVLREIMSRLGTKLIILSFVLLPFAILACRVADSFFPMAVPVILALTGWVHFTFVHLSGDRNRGRSDGSRQFDPPLDRSILSPARSDLIPTGAIRADDTAEIVEPPSVTERTTRIFNLD